MKLNYTFLFFIFLTTAFGQKTVNDSIEKKEHDKYESQILKKTQLPDLLNTKEEFYFRLSYYGTIIDIWKDSTKTINGVLTKFIYKSKSKKIKRDTIFEKYPLHNSKEIYKLINESKILDIPSEKEIKNWGHGHDGITYSFEFSDKKNYQIKSYWTPRAQDSTIIEAIKIEDFCKKIHSLVKQDSINEQFKNKLKPGFSYTTGSGSSMYILPNSSIHIDYKGNYRLPLGVYFFYYVGKLNAKKINFGTSFIFQNNLNNNTHFESNFYKWKIFGNNKTYYDSFRLIYEYNKLDYIKSVPEYENYKINYGGTIDKFIGFGFGYNQLKTDKTYKGFGFGISKKFESIHIEPYYTIDFFEKKITNYKVGIDKSFPIKIRNKNFRIHTNLFYEKTFDFKSLNFSLQIPIKSWTIN